MTGAAASLQGFGEWLASIEPRLMALFDEHQIPRPAGISESDGSWFALVLALAAKHEPGFHPFPGRPGAKPTALAQDAIIVFELGVKAAQTGKSVRAAALHLSKTPRFRGRSDRYIRRRYYDLLKATPEGRRLRAFLAEAGNQN